MLLTAAALIALLVAVRGAAIWSRLPDQVPVRWRSTDSATEWSSNNPVRWDDKTLVTVFGQIAMGLVALAVSWMLISTGAARLLMVRMRSFLFPAPTDLFGALEVCFYDDLLAWVCAGAAIAMALDSWGMWSLALRRPAPMAHVLAEATGPVIAIGLACSIAVTWHRLRQVLSDGTLGSGRQAV
jgi:hypothetical protein